MASDSDRPDVLGVGEGLVPAVEPLRACALQLVGGDRRAAIDSPTSSSTPRALSTSWPGASSAPRNSTAGSASDQAKAKVLEASCFSRQLLVQPPRRRVAEHQRQHLDGGEVGMRARRHVVGGHQQRRAAAAPQRDLALAVLRRVERVHRRQLARRLRDRAEAVGHPLQHLRRVEFAGDDERGVVGLVVQLVEGLQPRDVDVLDIAARADDRAAVGVPVVHRRHRALHQDAAGVVLAAFHLVAHHRHLGVEVFARDVAVDHRIGQPAQVPAQVVVVGREAGGVVGAVEAGAAVGGQAALGELGPHLGVLGRALEQHVLQQVRHAGLADVLVARADAVGQVDGGGGLGVVGYQQDLQAVGQPVFVDALDRAHRGHAGRQGLRGQRREKGQRGQTRAPGGAAASAWGGARAADDGPSLWAPG